MDTSSSHRGADAPVRSGSSPSSFRKSLLNRRPLGSLPMKRCTYSVPWSCTAMAYFSGLTQDCRQKGTLVSPTVCLEKRHIWSDKRTNTQVQTSSRHVSVPLSIHRAHGDGPQVWAEAGQLGNVVGHLQGDTVWCVCVLYVWTEAA